MSNLSLDQSIIPRLLSAWARIEEGGVELFCLKGKMGSGLSSLARSFQNDIGDKCITWHLQCLLDEDDVNTLPKIVDGLWKNIRESSVMTNAIMESIDKDISMLKDEEDQNRLHMVRESLGWSIETKGVQAALPEDRPLAALVQLGRCIVSNFQTLIIIEDAHFNQGLTLYAWLDALIAKAPPSARLMVLITTADHDGKVSFTPNGLQILLQKTQSQVIWEKPIAEDALQQWLEDNQMKSSVETWMDWTEGQPGRIIELNQWLKQSPRNKLQRNVHHWEKSTLAVGLRGLSTTASEVGFTLDMDETKAFNALESDQDAGSSDRESSAGSPKWSFHTATHAEMARREAIKQKRFANNILKRIETRIEENTAHLLFQLMCSHADLNNEDEVDRIQEQFHERSGDQMWLHLADLLFGEQLNWPMQIEGKALLGALRRLCHTNNPRSARLLNWCMEWATRENSPKVAIESLRIAAHAASKSNNSTMVEKMLNDAIDIAQNASNTVLSAGVRLDLAALAAKEGKQQEMEVQLALLKHMKLTKPEELRAALIVAQFSESQGDFQLAATLWLKAREIASVNHFKVFAADAGIHAAEAHIANQNASEAMLILEKVAIEVRNDLPRTNRCREMMALLTEKQ